MRQVIAPCTNCFGERSAPRPAEVVSLRIASNQRGNLKFRQHRFKTRMPFRRAFGPWWQIPCRPCARIIKTGRDNRNLALIVESLAIQSHPVSQSIAGRVVPGYAGFMRAATRRLPDNHQSRGRRRPESRPRPHRKKACAMDTGTDIFEQRMERLGHAEIMARVLKLQIKNRGFQKSTCRLK